MPTAYREVEMVDEASMYPVITSRRERRLKIEEMEERTATASMF